ncbi:MAG TPA: sulfatase-like hydrolase/transferase [Chitinophagaceae bacterium]|nr:sulfatase-like hydrolase/transferase [Chitinophagaceae bacterium]
MIHKLLPKFKIRTPQYLTLLTLIFLAGFVSGQTKELKTAYLSGSRHPNVLVIITDQQSATMLSCAGNKWLKTPALDSLASAGVRFEKAYVTNPVCMPSRFSIQTGMFPSVAGIRENDLKIDQSNQAIIKSLYSRSLGNTFRKAGYDTYYGGKFHVPLENRNPIIWGYDVISKDDREGLANDVTKFLLNRKPKEKPFLLVVSFINPHDICFDAIRFGWPNSEDAKQTPPDLFDVLKIPTGISKKDFFDSYCPPLPDNFQPMFGESYTVDSLIRLRNFRQAVRDYWSEEDWRMHRWAYARLVEKVDSLIGRVLIALNKSGLKDNTIVIFTSDHGDNDASHKLEHKTVFYEEAARVPLIISYPGIKEKGIVDNLHIVSTGLDILPTLCDLANIHAPEDLPGSSLVPLINNGHLKKWRDHIFIENQLGYLIHTGRYKYELDDKSGNRLREVFSDLTIDPGETVNLINDSKYSGIIAELRKELLNHLISSHIHVIPPGN